MSTGLFPRTRRGLSRPGRVAVRFGAHTPPFAGLLALGLLLVLAVGGCARSQAPPPPPLTPELVAARLGLGVVRAVAISRPDGRLAAIASGSGRAYVWDVATHRLVALMNVTAPPMAPGEASATQTRHAGSQASAVSAVAFLDASRIITASEDGDLATWDAASGNRIASLGRHGSALLCLAVAPDGRQAWAGSVDGHIISWTLQASAGGRETAANKGAVRALALAPDGQALYSAGADGTVAAWQVPAVTAHPRIRPVHFAQGLLSLAVAGDGHVLTGSEDGQLRCLDGASLAVSKTWAGLAGPVSAIATEGSRVAAGSTNNNLAWLDLTDERGLQMLTGNRGAIRALAFTPDGSRVAAGGDERLVVLHTLSGRSHEPVPPDLGHPAKVLSVAWAPDGHVIASDGNGPNVLFWDPTSGALAGMLNTGSRGDVQAVAWSTQGLLATGAEDGAVRLYDARSGALLGSGTHHGAVNDVAFSADGKWLASGAWDNEIHLWHVSPAETGRGLQDAGVCKGHSNAVSAVSFSGDGKMLASSSWDHTVRVWDVATQKTTQRFEGMAGPVFSVGFSPVAPIVVAGGWQGQTWFWKADSGEAIARDGAQAGLQKDVIFCICFAPDGGSVATGSADRTVWFWDPRTHERRNSLTGFRDSVRALGWTRDARRIAVGTGDGYIFVLPVPVAGSGATPR